MKNPVNPENITKNSILSYFDTSFTESSHYLVPKNIKKLFLFSQAHHDFMMRERDSQQAMEIEKVVLEWQTRMADMESR